MKIISQSTENADEKFSLLRFTFSVGAIVISYILVLMLACPTILARQLESGVWAIVLVSLAFHLFNAAFEFFFHRYVLHCALFRWLKKFYEDHTLHHALTKIFRKNSKGCDLAEVVNNYPITKEKQYASSFFPYWGLAGFTLFFSPLTIFLQWRMPYQPVLLGSFIAITFSYVLYELLHALEHVPYEIFWKKIVDSPRFGIWGKKIYGFHMFHHASILSNMAISGFFGFPVFDWIFGTYKQPRMLLFDGTLAQEDDFTAPRPYWFIRWLDSLLFKKSSAPSEQL